MKNLWLSDNGTRDKPIKDGSSDSASLTEYMRLAPYMNTEADGTPTKDYKRN